MSHTLSRASTDGTFAGGELRVQTVSPGHVERLVFQRHGKTVWQAQVPTVHGVQGSSAGHRFFPIGGDHQLVVSAYEHSRGGHIDALGHLCNTRGVRLTAPVPSVGSALVSHDGDRGLTVYMLDAKASPATQPSASQFELGPTLHVLDLSGEPPQARRVPLSCSSQDADELLQGAASDRRWYLQVRFRETKSGTYFIEVRPPAGHRAPGRLKLPLERY